MFVEFGNQNAVEGYRDPAKAAGGQDAPLEFRPLDGQRVTRLDFPEGMSIAEAFSTSVATVAGHFAALPDGGGTHAPVWVESDSAGLAALLSENYGIPSARPQGWGQDSAEQPQVAAAEQGQISPAADAPALMNQNGN